ncbi:MAG: ABC transporter ATP-binding protein [Bdellovibrionales bacterium]
MITAKNLTKNYGNRTAIRGVSFEIQRGEIVGFLGPNGAGKTTTMKILTGYMAPHEGEVFIDGINISEQPILAKKKLGYLPEMPPVYGEMYVEDYLKYVARLKLCEDKKIPKLVGSALEKAGLVKVRSRLIQNLSKGFKQRVGLAQALVSDPEILILDEPTVGLDPKQVIEMRELLSQLKGQHTIILSTHILPEVQVSCERVIIINEGKIVTQDSLEGLSQKMAAKSQTLLKVKKANKSLLEKLKSIKGVLGVESSSEGIKIDSSPNDNINEEIAKMVIDEKYGLLEIKNTRFDLEDVFIRLTNK